MQSAMIILIAVGHILAVQSSAIPSKNIRLLTENVPLELDFCKQLGYSQTSKINFMKQKQSRAMKDYLYKALLILDKTGCSPLVKGYTCATYAPKYLEEYKTALPPCRSLCSNTEKACSRFNAAMARLLGGSCKMAKIGAGYRGTVSKTRHGLKCQRWDSQFPHKHAHITSETHPNAGLEENYCRNPDRESSGPWCYTTSDNTRWDYCDVPLCKTQFYCDYYPNEEVGCVDYTYNEETAALEMVIRGNPKKRLQDWSIPDY